MKVFKEYSRPPERCPVGVTLVSPTASISIGASSLQSAMGCGSATLVMRLCGSAQLRVGVPGSAKTVGWEIFGGRPRLRFTGRDSVLVSSVDARDFEEFDAIGAASVHECSSIS